MVGKAIIIFLVLSLSLYSTSPQLEYVVEKEWVKLIVNEDGSITLAYNLTIRVVKGTIKKYVRVGMPCRDFKVLDVYELETGERLSYKKVVEESYYAVTILLKRPITEGTSRTFILIAEVYNFIYEDKTNVGYAGFKFIPCWWDVPVSDLKVLVILPPKVKTNEFRCTPDYHNMFTVEGRIALFWDFGKISAGDRVSIGVSFPRKYVENVVEVGEEGEGFFEAFVIVLSIALFIFIFLFAIVRKSVYEAPTLSIEALGPRKGLTAVEAAYLIMETEGTVNYGRILTMILYSLLRKGAVKVTSIDPLKVEVINESAPGLRYYEKRFIKCVNSDGTLNEDCLVDVIKVLASGVRNLIRGYSRFQTVAYYRDIVKRAWREVLEARTPEVKLEKFNSELEWLLVDPDFEEKVRDYFRINYFVPRVYLRYPWYDNLIEPVYYGGKVERVNVVDLADRIASSVERASNNIVRNVEKFSQRVARVVEGERRTSRPVMGTCVCACVSCACVCACVSCACACASGGAG